MKHLLKLAISAAVAALAFCFSATAQDYDIESIKVEQDGSLTVRVWGNGRNKADALELARKNAVYDVIFKGVVKGVAKGYYTRPLVTTVNAREKYQDYFDLFFMDKGEYAKYVSKEDKRVGSNAGYRGKVQVEFCTTVRVLVPQLRARLKADGIIKEVED